MRVEMGSRSPRPTSPRSSENESIGGQPAAKMLVRSGLRCTCCFRLPRECQQKNETVRGCPTHNRCRQPTHMSCTDTYIGVYDSATRGHCADRRPSGRQTAQTSGRNARSCNRGKIETGESHSRLDCLHYLCKGASQAGAISQ